MQKRLTQPPLRSGLSLLELLIVLGVIGCLTGLTMSAVQRARAAGQRAVCADNMRQLVSACQNYHVPHRKFPCGLASRASKDPYPYMGWHTRLLPYVEQQGLWTEAEVAFRLNPDFTHPPLHPGSSRSVRAFGCPSDQRTQSPQSINDGTLVRGLTSYLGIAGTHADRQDGVFFLDSSIRLGDIADGTSNTILIGERPPSKNMLFGWWYAR